MYGRHLDEKLIYPIIYHIHNFLAQREQAYTFSIIEKTG